MSQITIKIESNDELKEIDIKNCTYYYFDHIMRADFSGILSDKKL